MSWLFSQALVEEFSGGNSWGGEPCAQLNVMPTAQPFWRSGKPMDASRLSRFGLTLRLLTADHGEALLMWFREASRARTSALLDQAMDLTASAQDSGRRWRGSFARYDQESRTWKTAQCSLLGGFTEFWGTWPRCGSMRNGECYQRPTLELHTCANESGLLPTPVAVDTGSYFNRSASDGAALQPTLGAMARYDLWPTPTVKGNYNRKGLSKQSGDGLATAVMKWPTPKASDGAKGGPNSIHGSGSLSLPAMAARFPTPNTVDAKGGTRKGVGQKQLCHTVGGQLNPDWVEWLMGWPIGWTALQPLETDRFREWLRKHSSCLPTDSP